MEPLLLPHPPRPKGGRPPIPDRACFTGIVFVLKTGIQWEDLPQEMRRSSGKWVNPRPLASTASQNGDLAARGMPVRSVGVTMRAQEV